MNKSHDYRALEREFITSQISLRELCRRHGVHTPEDPYLTWDGEGGPCLLVPLFLLYDYSFRPADVAEQDAVAWAAPSGDVLVSSLDAFRAFTDDPYQVGRVAAAKGRFTSRFHSSQKRLSVS